jgi:hypothetical protein
MTSRHLAAAAVYLALLAAAGPAVSASAAPLPTTSATPPPTASGVHVFHGLQGLAGSKLLTLQVAEQTAQVSDVVSATPGELAKYAVAMKTANPNVILLAYVNGGYSKAGTQGSLPASEYMYSTSGAYITSRTHQNILMNPLSPDWQANVIAQCKAAVGGNVTGCWLDQISGAPVTAGFDSAQPVNPATGVNYTKPEWAAAAATELTVVNAGAGTTVYSNTYCSGAAYYSFPMSAANHATSLGFEAEHWMTSTASGAHTLKTWRQGINMMIDSQAHGKVVTVSGDFPTTGTWPTYITASYMLGNNGAALTTYTARVAATVGAPTQTATSVAGYQHGLVYARKYRNGIVIVNPTPQPHTYAGHTVAAYSGYIGA